jgi:hypothetical protein
MMGMYYKISFFLVFTYRLSSDHRLFLGLCDSDWIGQILLEKNKRDGKAICAMRFGSIHHMTSAKNIGIRIDLADSKYFIT